ncbi:ABC transporter ATP-binding protein [Gephyromycinifex aptenodytis]|uniref:ABC transporter ATP-binding protein n=1 Tax=Gephyromycinifex aptenodytis TaxID=2716227 RepID=UPI0014472E02|nr:ABC transporter ATP-binding protein [Gephyromycinifex aptenodytis]
MTTPELSAESLCVGYEKRCVIDGFDLEVASGEFTAIIGPNACGKSTLLKALARLLPASAGRVVLDGRPIHDHKTVEVAKVLGLLPQHTTVAEGIRVADLVSRGRFAHQRFLRRWNEKDTLAVEEAMRDAKVSDLATRVVDELSGGQRQRVWLATVLAQQTPLLLLDEPTTYLDINHQLEVMELCSQLNRRGRTVVTVLHDLNHAARFATHVVAMREGRLVAQGPPAEVLTPDLLAEVFAIEAQVLTDPVTGGPLVVAIRPLPKKENL